MSETLAEAARANIPGISDEVVAQVLGSSFYCLIIANIPSDPPGGPSKLWVEWDGPMDQAACDQSTNFASRFPVSLIPIIAKCNGFCNSQPKNLQVLRGEVSGIKPLP